MLRRLTLGLVLLAGITAAACSTNVNTPSSGGVPGEGPNFVTNTIYIADTTANAVDIYTPAPGPSATPEYQIAGNNTGLIGPEFMAFNSSKQLYVTNYNSATRQSALQIYQTFATGNVLPLPGFALAAGDVPRGIAFMPNGDFAIAVSAVPQALFNAIYIYDSTNLPVTTIGGSNTGLNAPVGLAVDANSLIYAANSGSGSVTVYALPSPTPTPSGSPSPTPSPTPTPVPSVSPTPTPVPTPVADNLTPVLTLTNGLTSPQGITLDSKGDLYVADSGSKSVAPSVAIFKAPLANGMPVSATITSSAFIQPTDVKVDSTGTIYVIDGGNAPGKGRLLIFAPGASGNATPRTAINLPPGTATGMALSP